MLAIGNISTPYPDSPVDEVENATACPPMVDLVGEADEDKAGQSEGEGDMPEPGDVDEFLRDHQTFRLKTSSRSRRTYSIGYLDNQTTVGDLHFEFARVSKRGARQFRLVQAGVILDGVLRLGMVDADIDILVEPHSYDDLGESPLSARRRGGDCRAGAPSSVRSKIARKISKSAQPIPGALDLVQQLWVLESETLRATNGTPDQVRTVIWSLAQKHGARWVGGEWQLDSHQIPTKGVAQSGGQSRQAAGVPVIHIKDSPKKASEFECLKVVSQMVGNDGTPLPVVSRDAYALGERACVLCDADYFVAFAQTLGDKPDALVLINRALPKTVAWTARKTQIMVEAEGGKKLQYCWVVSCSSQTYTVVHPVADVLATQTDSVSVFVRVVQDIASPATLEAMSRRDFLCLFFGSVAKDVQILGKKEQFDPTALVWRIQPREDFGYPALLGQGRGWGLNL